MPTKPDHHHGHLLRHQSRTICIDRVGVITIVSGRYTMAPSPNRTLAVRRDYSSGFVLAHEPMENTGVLDLGGIKLTHPHVRRLCNSEHWRMQQVRQDRARTPASLLVWLKTVAAGFQPAIIRLKADPTHGFETASGWRFGSSPLWDPALAGFDSQSRVSAAADSWADSQARRLVATLRSVARAFMIGKANSRSPGDPKRKDRASPTCPPSVFVCARYVSTRREKKRSGQFG
jgi:hypothetical protein